jgi:hypothetical protein
VAAAEDLAVVVVVVVSLSIAFDTEVYTDLVI